MFDVTIITGLASIMGCLCMGFVCATQMRELFLAAQPAPQRPWDVDFTAAPTRAVFTGLAAA